MIEELSIRIKDGCLTHTISIDTDIEGNMTYDIACAIEKVVDLTQVNADMVIEQLVDTYGLPERLKQQDDTEEPTCVTWYSADKLPCINRAIYIVFEDDNKTPLIVNGIHSNSHWLEYAQRDGVKQWCYLNDVLKEGYKI